MFLSCQFSGNTAVLGLPEGARNFPEIKTCAMHMKSCLHTFKVNLSQALLPFPSGGMWTHQHHRADLETDFSYFSYYAIFKAKGEEGFCPQRQPLGMSMKTLKNEKIWTVFLLLGLNSDWNACYKYSRSELAEQTLPNLRSAVDLWSHNTAKTGKRGFWPNAPNADLVICCINMWWAVPIKKVLPQTCLDICLAFTRC